MSKRWMIGVGALAALAAQDGVRAQNATVREIVRVVKTVPASGGGLNNARVNGPLGTGDRVRTGGRSAAGIRFNADRSLLRVGELSEILITGGRGRDAQMVRGRVLADYKTPTTLRSGNAIAAIRGTKVEMRYDHKKRRTQVNCYHGRVFVSNARNPIRAGTADSLTATTLTDDDLQGSDVQWVGGELRFIDGPLRGETRKITAFDASTGTLTVEPALPAGCGDTGGHGYLVEQQPGGKVVELLNNQGTEVKGDGDPSDPYNIPHIEFAGLDRRPYWEELQDGMALYVYPGTPQHEQDRDESWPERDAIEKMTEPGDEHLACGCHDDDDETPDTDLARPFGARRRLARAFANSLHEREHLARIASAGGAAPRFSGTPSAEERALPGYIAPAEIEGHRNNQFRFEPFAFGSDDSDAFGARVRFQGTTGSVYGELGYRFLRSSGDNDHDISEGFLHIKGRYGNVIAGRQHLFLGPSNNTELGRLLGLEASDAVLYDAPMPRGFKQQVGYIIDTRALEGRGFNAWYARGLARVWHGNLGYSLMAEPEDGRNIGWQVDGAQPLIRNVLDVYGEIGHDTRGRELYSAGFYVPWAYHRAKIDIFTEYARREGVEERLSLRLRREMGNGLLLIAFINNRLGTGEFTVGGGVMWSKKFR